MPDCVHQPGLQHHQVGHTLLRVLLQLRGSTDLHPDISPAADLLLPDRVPHSHRQVSQSSSLAWSLPTVDCQSVDLPSGLSDSLAAPVWPGETWEPPADSERGEAGLPRSLHLSAHHRRPALLHRPGRGRHDGLPPPGLPSGGDGRQGQVQAGGLSGAHLPLPAFPSASTSDLDCQRSTGRQESLS